MIEMPSYGKNRIVAFYAPLTLREQFVYSGVLVVLCVIFFYDYLDIPIALYFNQLNHSSINHFFHYLTLSGEAFPYIALSIIGYMFFTYYRRETEKANRFGLLLQAVLFSGVLTDMIKWIAGRYRPHEYFEHHLYGFDFFQIKGAYTSFPSGHTTTAFAVATLLAYLFPKFQWMWWSFAFLIGLSRIVLTQHFVSDVIVGAYIGIASVVFLLLLRNIRQTDIYHPAPIH